MSSGWRWRTTGCGCPAIASEVALAVDATIQRTGLYEQRIHVLSEMNKTIACSVDKARARARLRAAASSCERACAARSDWCIEAGQEI